LLNPLDRCADPVVCGLGAFFVFSIVEFGADCLHGCEECLSQRPPRCFEGDGGIFQKKVIEVSGQRQPAPVGEIVFPLSIFQSPT
jgi:hypothetical protein